MFFFYWDYLEIAICALKCEHVFSGDPSHGRTEQLCSDSLRCASWLCNKKPYAPSTTPGWLWNKHQKLPSCGVTCNDTVRQHWCACDKLTGLWIRCNEDIILAKRKVLVVFQTMWRVQKCGHIDPLVYCVQLCLSHRSEERNKTKVPTAVKSASAPTARVKPVHGNFVITVAIVMAVYSSYYGNALQEQNSK